METLPVYVNYIELNSTQLRKLIEKRPMPNGLSSEG